MTQTTQPSWLTGAIAAMRKDPKKAGVLAMLAVLLVVMAVRTVGPGRPRGASAASVTSALGRKNSSGAGAGNNANPQQRHGPAGLQQHLLRWAERPVPQLTRNLFAVRLEYFPVEGPRTGAGGAGRADDGFWARLEKSLVLQADQRDKRENQIANYMAKASSLKLQSTMMGPQPKALVNGELVGEGDVVAEFRVVKIEARRMIVEREGIRLEIQMK
jgi:hypothetical protein